MIIMKNQAYDGISMKPTLDEAIEHYGVKGMKWRRRKSKSSGTVNRILNYQSSHDSEGNPIKKKKK